MRLEELVLLAGLRGLDAQPVVERIYEWRRERLTLIGRGSFAFAASLLIGVALAALSDDTPPPAWVLPVATASALAFVVVGWIVLGGRVPRLQREYVVAVSLLDALG